MNKREIKIPSYSPMLAEFIGALAGDGHLTHPRNNIYRIEFTLNGTEDRFYAEYLAELFEVLFDVQAKVYRRKGSVNRVDVQIHSKEVHEFLSGFFPLGKKESLNVPEWIESEKQVASYLRGLMDTDGSLFFAKRGMYERNCYPVMEIKIYDELFLDQVAVMLDRLDISFYRSSEIKIQMNGKNRLEMWKQKVGFSNPNRSSRYYLWKVKNYCPPDTTLDDRLKMLGIVPG